MGLADGKATLLIRSMETTSSVLVGWHCLFLFFLFFTAHLRSFLVFNESLKVKSSCSVSVLFVRDYFLGLNNMEVKASLEVLVFFFFF